MLLLRAVGSGTHSLRAVDATLSMESDLAIDGESQFIGAEFATANPADVFGVRPSLGRWFVDDREPVAVISDAMWERYFDRRPDALGRVIQSGTDSYTIVGLRPANSQAYAHRYEPISGRPSRPVFGRRPKRRSDGWRECCCSSAICVRAPTSANNGGVPSVVRTRIAADESWISRPS
jgi:MacB-like protein